MPSSSNPSNRFPPSEPEIEGEEPPRTEVLRERVEQQHEELRSAVEALELAARRAVDVRHWIRARPGLWTAGAFLLGLWLGGRNR